jgi:pyruvate/2-oxoglutarate dehydrogenase complex dihydrolipoamide dehydrogenase (E3) component
VTLVEEKENLLPSWDAVAGEQIRHTLEAQGVIIKLNEKTDLPLPETWTECPVLELCDGTIASPGLTLIATGRKPNVEELGLNRSGSLPMDFCRKRKDADGPVAHLRDWRRKWVGAA